MKKAWILSFAFLCLVLFSACAGKPVEAAAAVSTPAPPAEEPSAPAAEPVEVSLEGLVTVEDVQAYLDGIFPLAGGGKMIPYAADFYHAGDNTLTWTLQGFCTRSGEILTKPVFGMIAQVEAFGDSWPEGTKQLYLCSISGGAWEDVMLITPDGKIAGTAMELAGRYREPSPDPSLIEGLVDSIFDDGVYYVDGYYALATPDGGSEWRIPGAPEGGYRICRKSDGAEVAVTDRDSLEFCGDGDGRVYFTKSGDCCCTYDSDFNLILQVRAIGAKRMDMFERPPEEIAPGEPLEALGEPVALSEQQQYQANIFLSNFSEQGFCQFNPFSRFDASDTSVAQLYDFAHFWAKINRRALIQYDGSYETLSRENYNFIVSRYFDLDEIPQPYEGQDLSAELGMGNYEWDRCWYEGGLFRYPAADGESHTAFSVVDEASVDADGRYTFHFTIYSLDLDIYWDNNGIPGLYYHLTPAGAAQRADMGEITPVRKGTAVCSPGYHADSGMDSYLLIRYAIDPVS